MTNLKLFCCELIANINKTIKLGTILKTLSVVVTTPPQSPLTYTAIDYINKAIAANVKLTGIFFYQDGVLNAAKNLVIPNDEYQINKAWQQLNQQHNIELHVCISACEKRGLSDEILNNTENNNTNQLSTSNISEFFTVSGLGELVELTVKSERLVQF